jgi:hypothetical protein
VSPVRSECSVGADRGAVRRGGGMAASARDSADAAERVVDDHDGWASDAEMDVEMDVVEGDADRRDGGADGDDEYLLVRMAFPGAPAVGGGLLILSNSQI